MVIKMAVLSYLKSVFTPRRVYVLLAVTSAISSYCMCDTFLAPIVVAIASYEFMIKNSIVGLALNSIITLVGLGVLL